MSVVFIFGTWMDVVGRVGSGAGVLWCGVNCHVLHSFFSLLCLGTSFQPFVDHQSPYMAETNEAAMFGGTEVPGLFLAWGLFSI